jgi:peptide-methionine (R)-S-oxide reductase
MLGEQAMAEKLRKTEAEWQQELTPEQYRVLRQKGTERPFSGEYAETNTPGVYRCAACGQELFASATKFDAGCGWPSFYQPVGEDRIEEHQDNSYGMRRVEVTCARCDSHLGHVFPDGPRPTGLRYCINAVALKMDRK